MRRGAAVACALALGIGLAATPRDAHAQGEWTVWAGVTGASAVVRTLTPGGENVLRGTLFGGEGGLRVGPVAVAAGYAEGTARPERTGANSATGVDAYVKLALRPLPGLEITFAPTARAWITSVATQRVVSWASGMRYEHTLGAPWISAFGTLWAVLAGNAGAAAFAGGRGGAAGLRVQAGAWALGVRYAIDETRFSADPLRQTVEELQLTLQAGLR